MINFFKGHPTAAILPKAELSQAFALVIEHNWDYEEDPVNRHPLNYGTDPGNYTVRDAIEKWSSGKFGRRAGDPDCINLTGGASYGIANILLACTRPETTKHAFIVSPTYFLINYAFVDAGFNENISAVNETPNAAYDIDIEGLETKLQQLGKAPECVVEDPLDRGKRKFYRFVMYLVPTFSNPGGLVYSLKTRAKLLQLAREYDILLITDDVYDYLSYDGRPPQPKLTHLDRDSLTGTFGHTVSNASFSKIVAPGLRVGWQETASPALAKQLASTGANKSGGTPGQLNSAVVEKLINDGTLDHIIARFAKIYKSRADTVKRVIAEKFPKQTVLYGGEGGYFFWVTIPNVNMRKSLEAAQEKGVLIPQGGNFEVHGNAQGWGQRGARLCISLLTEEEIESGLETWASVL